MAGRQSRYRSRGWLANASFLGLSWVAAGASAAPQPLSTTFEVSVGSFIGNPVGEFDSADVFDTVTFTFSTAEPLTLSGEAVATQGAGFSRTYETIAAVITPFAGSVTLLEGYEIVNPDFVQAYTNVTGHVPWSYTFLPDADAMLVFEYVEDQELTGNLSFMSSGNAPVNLFGSGTIQRSVVAGVPFTIGLDMFVGPSCFGSCSGSDSVSTTFTWSIVPEPSTLPAVACGLLALGARRRLHGRHTRPSKPLRMPST